MGSTFGERTFNLPPLISLTISLTCNTFHENGKIIVMRFNQNIKLRDIAGERMLVVGTSTSVDLTKVVLLNKTAEFLWDALKEKDFSIEDVADLLTETYNIDKQTALNDAGNWADSMVKAGLCI